ncbi:hypothetical protein FH694_10385, partial [Streptococcus suis]|uniref:mechanosensitive ion channel family protein n=1 Tax=Streptococcus suis TaxID=1307 RepID=UPI00116664B1
MDSNLSSWTDSVTSGVGDALHRVVVGIPDVLAAIVVVLVGVIVGAVLKNVVVRVLRVIKVGSLAKRVQLERVFPVQLDFVELVGDLVKWFFIIVFLLQALSIAHLQEASDLVARLLGYV